MKRLAENLWLLTYPLRMFGADMRRNVTVIRLASGELIIHSTAPFDPADTARIRALGSPAWIVEAMRFHDTFSRHGRDIFPDIPFLAPEGFHETVGFPTEPLMPPPAAWEEEIAVLAVAGNPSYGEHVLLHRPSRTLIVADLAFNFPAQPAWTELLLRLGVGSHHAPGMSRPFRVAITDQDAFRESMETMLSWDFDRVIVGHGDVIESDGHQKISAMLAEADFVPTTA